MSKPSIAGMEVKLLKINEVRPYSNNPRYNLRSILLLEEAIERFGFLVPITVDKDHVIVTGHSRYTAARNINLEEIPVVVLDKLSDREIREYRIADNKVGEFSELNFDLKAEALREYADGDELMASAFPNFAPDFSTDDDDEEIETDGKAEIIECMCPNCLHEFDANTGYPFETE